MISITKGQLLKDNPELEVLSPSGSYDVNDIIQCAKVGETEAFCSYEAQFVVYGRGAYDDQVIPTT